MTNFNRLNGVNPDLTKNDMQILTVFFTTHTGSQQENQTATPTGDIYHTINYNRQYYST